MKPAAVTITSLCSSNIDEARVVHVTEGKDAATVAAFAGDLIEHGGDPDQITDRHEPHLHQGTAEHLPNAAGG
jgi:transposase